MSVRCVSPTGAIAAERRRRGVEHQHKRTYVLQQVMSDRRQASSVRIHTSSKSRRSEWTSDNCIRGEHSPRSCGGGPAGLGPLPARSLLSPLHSFRRTGVCIAGF